MNDTKAAATLKSLAERLWHDLTNDEIVAIRSAIGLLNQEDEDDCTTSIMDTWEEI